MPITPSPLRYPGGKTKLYNIVRHIVNQNALCGCTYVEPFGGGAGLALKLLYAGDVSRIVINDADCMVYSFWYAVLNHTDALCSFVADTKISVETWLRMRNLCYGGGDGVSTLELAQATLFLNRVNVSGILKGGLIGGMQQQGKYKLDARFNREEIIKKIQKVAERKEHIFLTGMDIFDFLKSDIFQRSCGVRSLVNFDPPYYGKGKSLYNKYFEEDDHRKLREAIGKLQGNWILTYDDCEFIRKLYEDYPKVSLNVSYGTRVGVVARELMFYSRGLSV